jgi:hypothetical protein
MLQVRKLQESDWKFLPQWWDDYNQEPWIKGEEFRDIMPGAFQVGEFDQKRLGLGGFIVCKDKHPIAAIWLYLGNGNCTLPTAAVSDPGYRDTDRKKAIQLLVDFITDFSKDLGYKYAFTWAQEGAMLDYYLKAGYKKWDKPSYELIKKL